MAGRPASISVTRCGHERPPPAVLTSARQVGEVLRTYAGAPDVTISVRLPHERGTLLLALEAGRAFIGLQVPDGIYQYVADETAEGQRKFITGDQPTFIDRRYVLPAATAIELLMPWLAGSDPLAAPRWERQ